MAKKRKKNRKGLSGSMTAIATIRESIFPLPEKVKKIIFGTVFFLLSVVVLFSFFNLSGVAGSELKNFFIMLTGRTVFFLPFIFVLLSLVCAKTKYKKFALPAFLSFLLITVGISGFFEILGRRMDLGEDIKNGGWIGYAFGLFLMNLFDFWLSAIFFLVATVSGLLIFNQLIRGPFPEKKLAEQEKSSLLPSIFKRVIGRRSDFQVKNVDGGNRAEESAANDYKKETEGEKAKISGSKEDKEDKKMEEHLYRLPPLSLLDADKGAPNSGDVKINSTIIKRTLENFDISVEMSEVNVGPTVAQYTFKPAEGVKLSRITSLSSDLSLALAAHPIRIEAPIPGRSLVGIEIPNKERAGVRLRNLAEHPGFQKSHHRLLLVFGRDVSGVPVFANLAKMPHMLVAGSTGTGKTIFLNTLILSLLYKNTPETLRLIMVDPKRVEFTNFSNIPHLLAPVIFDVNKTCNALKWLVGEMERRLQVLADSKSRDIGSYNEKVVKENGKKNSEKKELMPYIVLVVDELADLMAAKGREVEAGIVRLAQMARAAGIHLILATQRPSVEVITGLIKANVPTRVTFQVISQVDSRTVLDTSGAERLIGAGDMLFISGEVSRPKRVQGPYVSEKELRNVVKWVKDQHDSSDDNPDALGSNLEEELMGDQSPEPSLLDFSESEDVEDTLYEEAKKMVVETGKASASLLQRRLRVGYARAARLLDILEERGVVGPADGAKPRDIYLKKDSDEDGNEWEKI